MHSLNRKKIMESRSKEIILLLAASAIAVANGEEIDRTQEVLSQINSLPIIENVCMLHEHSGAINNILHELYDYEVNVVVDNNFMDEVRKIEILSLINAKTKTNDGTMNSNPTKTFTILLPSHVKEGNYILRSYVQNKIMEQTKSLFYIHYHFFIFLERFNVTGSCVMYDDGKCSIKTYLKSFWKTTKFKSTLELNETIFYRPIEKIDRSNYAKKEGCKEKKLFRLDKNNPICITDGLLLDNYTEVLQNFECFNYILIGDKILNNYPYNLSTINDVVFFLSVLNAVTDNHKLKEMNILPNFRELFSFLLDYSKDSGEHAVRLQSDLENRVKNFSQPLQIWVDKLLSVWNDSSKFNVSQIIYKMNTLQAEIQTFDIKCKPLMDQAFFTVRRELASYMV